MSGLGQRAIRKIIALAGVCALSAFLIRAATSQMRDVELTGRVELQEGNTKRNMPDASGAVVWLTAVAGTGDTPVSVRPSGPLRLTQHNKSFEPRLLVVPVGAVVEFPNHDPFFHNVFSLFEGKRFDLGLYEAGATRNVHFDRVGVSYIFCNIHPEMSAVVIALDTPYYAISNQPGEIVIPNVPPGRYVLHVWHQASLPDALNSLTREITVSANESLLGVIRLIAVKLPPHKNKYGRDYDRPNPSNPAYARP